MTRPSLPRGEGVSPLILKRTRSAGNFQRYFTVKGRGIINERDEVIYDFQGQPIRLPWERWLHIIDPDNDHDYMASMRTEMEETLRDPDLIVRSTRIPERVMLYHKWFEHTEIGNKWLRVVVNFLSNGDAFVMTSYVENEVIAGEVLWRKEQG